MKIRKTTAKLMAFLLAVCMLATTALAYDGIYTDKEGNISYSPYEQGLYSNGGYTIDKVSHPTLGARKSIFKLRELCYTEGHGQDNTNRLF